MIITATPHPDDVAEIHKKLMAFNSRYVDPDEKKTLLFSLMMMMATKWLA